MILMTLRSGERHGLPLINVLDAEACIYVLGNAEFMRGLPAYDLPVRELGETATRGINEVQQLQGVDRFLARQQIVELMDSFELLAQIEPHTHMVPHGDRSGVIIEPWLTDQWYVDAKNLARPALAAVHRARRSSFPRIGRRPIFNGSKTFSLGASRVSSGGAIKSQLGMDQNSRVLRVF